MLDAPRLLIGAAILLYAVHTDLRTRRVPNRTWLLPIGAGLAMDVPDAIEGGIPFLREAALSAGFVIPLALLTYHSRGFGGADAKAFISLSILVPRWPALDPFPLEPVAVPPFGIFTFAVFCNALLAGLLAPPALLLGNLRKGHRSRYAWLGHPVSVSRLDPVRMNLLGDPTGALGRRMGGREVTPEVLDHLRTRLGEDAEVWVTPKLPFMIPLLAGYGAALLVGNLLLLLVRALLGR